MAVGMYEDLVKNIEKAVVELAQIEKFKKSMTDDIRELNQERDRLKLKNIELAKSFDEKEKTLALNKSSFEQRIEIENKKLSEKDIELKNKEIILKDKDLNISEKLNSISSLKKEIEVLIEDAKSENILKSDQIKKVLERLRK